MFKSTGTIDVQASVAAVWGILFKLPDDADEDSEN